MIYFIFKEPIVLLLNLIASEPHKDWSDAIASSLDTHAQVSCSGEHIFIALVDNAILSFYLLNNLTELQFPTFLIALLQAWVAGNCSLQYLESYIFPHLQNITFIYLCIYAFVYKEGYTIKAINNILIKELQT